MTKQYAFYYDARRCVGCRTCELACKSTNNVELGIKWRRVSDGWDGEFPAITRSFLSIACLHCAKPACIKACSINAIYKRIEDGIVVVDKDRCNGCQDCFAVCPFGAPQFGNNGIMQKCDFCLSLGKEPACVLSCPAEALSYGTMEDLSKLILAGRAERYPGDTEPSFIIRK